MKFFRLKSNSKLFSFGDDIGDVPILDHRLIDLQNDFINSIGGTVYEIENESQIADEAQYFLFEEDLFFTANFIKACLLASKQEKKSFQFCLKSNTFNERFCLPTTDDRNEIFRIGLYYKNGKHEFEDYIIDQKIYEHIVEVPDQIVSGGIYHMDLCDTFATHLISPFHLLFANLAMNLQRTIGVRSKFNPQKLQLLGLNLSKWTYRGLKRMNKIGKNCNIHPSAIIEGSVIGNNVKIGANAVVRLSTVYDDSYISDGVSVVNSVLGSKTYIANSNYINSCLTYDEVFLIHGPYQLSVFGSLSACFAVINCDIRLDQKTIKIPTTKGVIDSNQPLLGIAYGHRSKTGGGNIIAAGRIVPNDLHIAPPDNIILSFD